MNKEMKSYTTRLSEDKVNHLLTVCGADSIVELVRNLVVKEVKQVSKKNYVSKCKKLDKVYSFRLEKEKMDFLLNKYSVENPSALIQFLVDETIKDAVSETEYSKEGVLNV